MRQFGQKLSFWGSIDEQQHCPSKRLPTSKGEILERLNTIRKFVGLILAPTHHVQLDTPLENFWAMHKTITETPYAALKN